MTDELNVTFSVGTDVAAWFLFHPADLVHRRQDPLSWWNEDFAVSKEFAAGRLIAVSTGKDGVSNVRFTSRGLVEREQLYVRKTTEFRLRIQHGCLYLDGGWALPSANRIEPEECYSTSYGWITLPKGNYRATVHAIAWFEETGAMDENGYSTPQALAPYVVDIQPVAGLDEINPPTSVPDLDPIIYESQEDSLADEAYTESLAPEYPLLYWYEVIFPDVAQELDLSTVEDPFEIMDWHIVISQSIDEEAIGTLFRVSGLPGYSEEYGLQARALQGEGMRLVRLNRVFQKGEAWWVAVEPYESPAASVSQTAIDRLKQQFLAYAATNRDYQNHIEFPNFYAERVASLTEPKQLCWFVAHAIALRAEQQQALLHLSDNDLIGELNRLLEAKLSEI